MLFFMVLWWMMNDSDAHWQPSAKSPNGPSYSDCSQCGTSMGSSAQRAEPDGARTARTAEDRKATNPGGGSGFSSREWSWKWWKSWENTYKILPWKWWRSGKSWRSPCQLDSWENKCINTQRAAKCDDFISMSRSWLAHVCTLFGREYWNDTNTY